MIKKQSYGEYPNVIDLRNTASIESTNTEMGPKTARRIVLIGYFAIALAVGVLLIDKDVKAYVKDLLDSEPIVQQITPSHQTPNDIAGSTIEMQAITPNEVIMNPNTVSTSATVINDDETTPAMPNSHKNTVSASVEPSINCNSLSCTSNAGKVQTIIQDDISYTFIDIR